MLSSREVLKKEEAQCERCFAKDGKGHPASGFIVRLRKQNIDGRMMTLCQKCNARLQSRFHHNSRGKSHALSIEEIQSWAHYLFNP